MVIFQQNQNLGPWLPWNLTQLLEIYYSFNTDLNYQFSVLLYHSNAKKKNPKIEHINPLIFLKS